jgi:hypothetical protein
LPADQDEKLVLLSLNMFTREARHNFCHSGVLQFCELFKLAKEGGQEGKGHGAETEGGEKPKGGVGGGEKLEGGGRGGGGGGGDKRENGKGTRGDSSPLELFDAFCMRKGGFRLTMSNGVTNFQSDGYHQLVFLIPGQPLSRNNSTNSTKIQEMMQPYTKTLFPTLSNLNDCKTSLSCSTFFFLNATILIVNSMKSTPSHSSAFETKKAFESCASNGSIPRIAI